MRIELGALAGVVILGARFSASTEPAYCIIEANSAHGMLVAVDDQ
jgi:hypothetical protein